MTILDSFFILFESNTEKLDKGLEHSEKKSGDLVGKLGEVDKASAKVGEGLFKVVGKAAGLLGLGLSVHALVAGIKETAASYDELGKLASRFRSTTDAVDEFRDAAGLLGITEEKSTAALTDLDTAIQDTYLGLGRAKMVFEELGIRVTDVHGKIKPTTEVMGELANKLSKMEKGTQIRVMERLGLDPSLLKLFNSDLVALQQRMENIDRASGFNLENAVKRSQEYTKANKALSLEVNVLKMYMEKLLESFQVKALPVFTEALKVATKYVKEFTDYLMGHQRFIQGVFIAVSAAITGFLVPAAIRGAIAVWAMIAPFALIALAVVAVGAVFALLYDDVMNFIDGNDSLIGQVLQKWPVIGTIARGIWEALKVLWEGAKRVFAFFVEMWTDPKRAFLDYMNFIIQGIKTILGMIPGVKSALKFFGVDLDKGAEPTPASQAQAAVAAGQVQLGVAARSQLSSQTASSISNTRTATKSTTVQVDKIEVQTQSTDANGISKAIGSSMETQMRQAVNNFDDGVLA